MNFKKKISKEEEEYYTIKTILTARHDGAHLQSQFLGGRGSQLSMNLSPVWFTGLHLGEPGL